MEAKIQQVRSSLGLLSIVEEAKIQQVRDSLALLSIVEEENYPALRSAILERGGPKLIEGIRVALPDVYVATALEPEEDESWVVTTIPGDPFKIERETLIAVLKNILQILLVVSWASE